MIKQAYEIGFVKALQDMGFSKTALRIGSGYLERNLQNIEDQKKEPPFTRGEAIGKSTLYGSLLGALAGTTGVAIPTSGTTSSLRRLLAGTAIGALSGGIAGGTYGALRDLKKQKTTYNSMLEEEKEDHLRRAKSDLSDLEDSIKRGPVSPAESALKRGLLNALGIGVAGGLVGGKKGLLAGSLLGASLGGISGATSDPQKDHQELIQESKKLRNVIKKYE